LFLVVGTWEASAHGRAYRGSLTTTFAAPASSLRTNANFDLKTQHPTNRPIYHINTNSNLRKSASIITAEPEYNPIIDSSSPHSGRSPARFRATDFDLLIFEFIYDPQYSLSWSSINRRMTSHLERLPGELRNEIYEYALTMDEGICYREDDHGVGWLCLHLLKLGEHSGLMTATVEADVVCEADDEASARKRRKFISEDRDIDEPVQDLKETQKLVRVNGHIVACQLQFVNRLFRNETKALVLRYNAIYFLDSLSRISKFLSYVVGRKRSWIQKIVDREESGNSYSSSSSKPWDLVLKVEMHPKFAIYVHYPRANLDHENFL
jgi:hypothetical protein